MGVFLLNTVSLASGAELTFTGTAELGYNVIVENNQQKPTGTQTLVDEKGNSYTVYCVDEEVDLVKNSKYTLEQMDACTFISKEDAEKIRAILANSYPYITLAELQKRSGKSVYNKQEAITATQLAIWHYSNQKDYTPYVWPDYGYVKRTEDLRDWYLTLPGDVPSTEVANVIIEYTVDGETIDITYKADALNADGTEIQLDYVIDPVVTVISEGKDAEGLSHVVIQNPGVPITVTVSGTQSLGKNVYCYYPKAGRQSSQSMGGVTDASTEITAAKDIFVATPTSTPTATPTSTPTATPTSTPTAKPTCTPTAKPTSTPTATSTCKPTVKPTIKPIHTPTPKPTCMPKPTETPICPKTGDHTSIGFWVVLAVISACFGVAVFIRIKLRK